MKQNNVATPSKAYDRMKADWKFIRDLLGGTKQMRLCGKQYLPQFPAESEKNYTIRLSAATLTPFYRIACENMKGRSFAEGVDIKDVKDEGVEKYLENVDLTGRDIGIFLQDLFLETMETGIGYVFVDFTKDRPTETLDDEEKSGARPYFVQVRPENVISVRLSADGLRIEEARIKEFENVYENYTEKTIERVRVLTPGAFELWEKQGVEGKADTNWVLVDSGSTTLGYVPLIPFYSGKVAPFESQPPLLDIAYLNVKYYQCESNHDNALSVAQFPILAASGMADDDPSVEIGPKKLLSMQNASGKFYFVEHSGAALKSGRERMEDIKTDIALQGAKLLLPKSEGEYGRTATDAKIKETENTCTLQSIVKSFEDSAERAISCLLDWVKKDTSVEVSIKGSFEVTSDDIQQANTLYQMKNSGDLSRKTLWEELKRRSILSNNFDADEELKRLDMEGANDPMNDLTPPPFGAAGPFAKTKKPVDDKTEKPDPKTGKAAPVIGKTDGKTKP